MKKVRIYSLRKDLGLDNCNPILDACKQVGIHANSASSTITKSQARQVMELLTTTQPVSVKRPLKASTRSAKRKSKASSPVASTTPAPSLDSSANRSPVTQKNRKECSKSFANSPENAHHPSVRLTDPGTSQVAISAPPSVIPQKTDRSPLKPDDRQLAPQYLNRNRVFTIKITGLKGARMRHALTIYSVSFDRLGHEIQRINRSEAKIVDITVSP
ncbi:MAG: phycobilisome linker polypeptide [Synechococcus sp.]